MAIFTTPRTWVFDETPTEGTFNTHVRDNLNALRETTYTAITSNVTITATTESAANTIVTASAVTFDGAASTVIEFYCPAIDTVTALMQVLFCLYQDGASIGIMGATLIPASGGAVGGPIYLQRKITPAGGSRTYSIRAFKSGSTSPVILAGAGLTAGSYGPAFIRLRA